MEAYSERLNSLLEATEALQKRYELSKVVTPDYYEPGMMEYLDQSFGQYDPSTGQIILRFEVKGVRYDGRTELIEHVCAGDPVRVERDAGNPYNDCNFRILNENDKDLGNMPAALCNAMAPLYDAGEVKFLFACVSFVEPISKRNRHAKQPMLFVELRLSVWPRD